MVRLRNLLYLSFGCWYVSSPTTCAPCFPVVSCDWSLTQFLSAPWSCPDGCWSALAYQCFRWQQRASLLPCNWWCCRSRCLVWSSSWNLVAWDQRWLKLGLWCSSMLVLPNRLSWDCWSTSSNVGRCCCCILNALYGELLLSFGRRISASCLDFWICSSCCSWCDVRWQTLVYSSASTVG